MSSAAAPPCPSAPEGLVCPLDIEALASVLTRVITKPPPARGTPFSEPLLPPAPCVPKSQHLASVWVLRMGSEESHHLLLTLLVSTCTCEPLKAIISPPVYTPNAHMRCCGSPWWSPKALPPWCQCRCRKPPKPHAELRYFLLSSTALFPIRLSPNWNVH